MKLTEIDISNIQSIVPGIEIKARIGKSPLGSVYQIIHPQHGFCALKMIEGKAGSNLTFLKRFLGPIEDAINIHHDNVAQIFEVGPNYIIREFVSGNNLHTLLAEQESLSVVEATQLMIELLSGLIVLHDAGIVHKNLKPSNIIVDETDLKIIDFSLPPTSAHYLSPEQCKGKKSTRHSDIYAFALLYVFCLTGQDLCQGMTTKDIMENHLKQDLLSQEILIDYPQKIIDIIKHGLIKNPESRIENCRKILPELESVIDAELEKVMDAGERTEVLEPEEEIEPEPIASETEKEEIELNYDAPSIQLVAVEEPPNIKLERIEKFKQVATEMAKKLKTVNQTLYLLEDLQDSQEEESILFLDEMLRFITTKTGELLGADRTIIFLMDEEKDELLLIEEGGAVLNQRISTNEGITGEIIHSGNAINIPYDFYDDPRSKNRQKVDAMNEYRTYSMLTLPLFNSRKKLVAIVQLLNKLKIVHDSLDPLIDRIEKKGFTQEDQKHFQVFAPSIRMILESSHSLYKATQRQKAAASLMSAIQSLGRCSLDLEDTLKRVMNEAKKLLNADRITLWLLDNEKDELWAKIPISDGTVQEIRIPKSAGFVGQVVETNEPLLIPCDLYDRPDSDVAKNMDEKTGYRTVSLLCMPVFNVDNELIGVTQLINKTRQGFPDYDPKTWPELPDRWKASFSASDMEFMRSFNIQAGVAVQNARMFFTIKQQEQMQRDILRSLTNGVISTDQQGQVIIANERAKKLLGMQEQNIRNRKVIDMVKIKEGNFHDWLEAALTGQKGKLSQYYPGQTLVVSPQEQHSVNLSINAIADVNNTEKLRGALVVMEDISHEKRMKNMMYRYMTQEIVEKLLMSGDIKLGGKREKVTVLFSDIRSYTTLTEGMEAEEVVNMLNKYFEVMVDTIFYYQGTLDKYIGDAIMAVFGTPLPLKDHEWCAVQTALEMRSELLCHNEERIKTGKSALRIGIGLHTDEVISGNIGSSKRMELTCIGDGVNLASRLEGVSKQYGCDIIISDNTYYPCREKVYARELDYIVVKGKTEPVKIYDLLGKQEDPLPPEKEQMMELYQKGKLCYHQRSFSQALEHFCQLLKIFPNDKASKMHVERCRYFMENPPDESWDGVWKLTSK